MQAICDAFRGEPLPDGDTAQHSPRTQERLAAVQATELQLVAEDKKYHASTLAADVVVYGTEASASALQRWGARAPPFLRRASSLKLSPCVAFFVV